MPLLSYCERRMACVLSFLLFIIVSTQALSQTIRIDATPAHALNSLIDRLNSTAADKLFSEPVLKAVLSAGWQTVSYGQNTELHIEAWHWNPQGTWSDPLGRGYFTGGADLGDPIRRSYGYFLPHRGFTPTMAPRQMATPT
jgi:hypothetical protein